MHENYCEKYGEWAVISGGAQGIGATFAERFARMGMSLLLIDANSMVLLSTVERLKRQYPKIKVVGKVLDLADRNELGALLEEIDEWDIGVLVANAAVAEIGLWLDVPMATKVRQIDINCVSALMLCSSISQGMAARKRGGIIVMASGAADMGSSFITTYAATKAFDRVLAEGLYSELRPYGVDVTTVMPGSVDTPGFRDTLKPGQEPTALMAPIAADLVVDAALAGLGNKINVRPAASNAIVGLIAATVMKFLPRRQLMAMADKAVRAMYSR